MLYDSHLLIKSSHFFPNHQSRHLLFLIVHLHRYLLVELLHLCFLLLLFIWFSFHNFLHFFFLKILLLCSTHFYLCVLRRTLLIQSHFHNHLLTCKIFHNHVPFSILSRKVWDLLSQLRLSFFPCDMLISFSFYHVRFYYFLLIFYEHMKNFTMLHHHLHH